MRFGLYAGGFLGPFGGAILAVLIPQLRDAFGATTSQVTLAITAYLVPFAALQLVSGTIGERVGITRTVRTAYVGYAAFSVLAAFAPSYGPGSTPWRSRPSRATARERPPSSPRSSSRAAPARRCCGCRSTASARARRSRRPR